MSALFQLRRLSRLGLALTAALAFLPPLVTRLLMGQAFFLTGRGKLANFANTVAFFTELGIPMPELNAAFVSRLEFYGGIALILGLGTRLFAAGLASTMVVALLTADNATFLDAFFMRGDAGLTDVVPVVYGLFLLWLIVYGPGKLSLDALIARFLLREPGAEAAPAAGATRAAQA
jgi:putative oxidoreductase